MVRTNLESRDASRFTVGRTQLYFARDEQEPAELLKPKRASDVANHAVLEVEWFEDAEFAQEIQISFNQ